MLKINILANMGRGHDRRDRAITHPVSIIETGKLKVN